MPSWLLPLVFLACPVGMGLIMFFMMKGKRGEHASMASAKGDGSPQERLALLESERRVLEREIAARKGLTGD